MEENFQEHFIKDELTVVANSLGKLDQKDGTYMKDRDCKPCLKELLMFIERDNQEHSARVFIGSMNLVKSDFIPLINQYCEFPDGDMDMFTILLRICMNLTSSNLILFADKEKLTDKQDIQERNKIEVKLSRNLHNFKLAFANDDKIWFTLNGHLRHNTEVDVVFERLIILIRNVLHIPEDDSDSLGLPNGMTIHDMCLDKMDRSGILDTIIKIASETQRGAEYCFHLTEIVYLILRSHNPEALANAKTKNQRIDSNDFNPDKKRLAELFEMSKRARAMDTSARYGGHRYRTLTFQANNIRSVGGTNPMVLHKMADPTQNLQFNTGFKNDLRRAKNKRPVTSESFVASSGESTKSSKATYGLKVFCKEFLEKVYPNYMNQIKYNLIQKKAQDNDETYYLWMLQFFLAFNRHLGLDREHIDETLSSSTMHFVQILITTYQDKLKMEKKDFVDISKRMHLALKAFREMLKSLGADGKKFFTENEQIYLLLELFKAYDEPKHSFEYLKDLIDTNNIFLDMIEAAEIHKYWIPEVIKTHSMVLRKFKTNDSATNLAILNFLERIVASNNEIILFQASLFKCLLDIMSYHSSLSGHERFVTLGKHLMEKFGSMANKKRWMYQELLFWKTNYDIIEIENAVLEKKLPEPSEERATGSDDEDRLSTLMNQPAVGGDGSELGLGADETGLDDYLAEEAAKESRGAKQSNQVEEDDDDDEAVHKYDDNDDDLFKDLDFGADDPGEDSDI